MSDYPNIIWEAAAVMNFNQPSAIRGSLVVNILDYKPEGREFETRWGEISNLPNPSGRARP
jgi:hypothetical protein